MKLVILVVALLAARPADACGVWTFGTTSAKVAPAPAPPPEPERFIVRKAIGGVLVLSVLARWLVAMPRRVIA